MGHRLLIASLLAVASLSVELATPFGPASTRAQSADLDRAAWIGVKVLPKLNAEVKAENAVIDENKLSLPYVVQDVKGDSLYVGGHEKGWVKRSEVVKLDEASAYYTAFIERGDHLAWAYDGRGIARALTGELDHAIADFGEELRLEPSARAYARRGSAWALKLKYDQAIADYDQAIRLEPQNAWAYGNRGIAWLDKQETDKAIADFDQAIRLDPSHWGTYKAAAWLQAMCPDARYRNGKRAVELATKACELSSWLCAPSLDALAAAYAENGDFEAAVKWQQKAIDLSPDDAEFLKGANQRRLLYRQQKPYHEESGAVGLGEVQCRIMESALPARA